MAGSEKILAVNNIEVIYDHVILVLKGVSLDVPKGGIVALLGANGAGKTTTLKAISNLLRAERGDVTRGSILFEGAEVHNLSPNELDRRGWRVLCENILSRVNSTACTSLLLPRRTCLPCRQQSRWRLTGSSRRR